ncbi:MBL fold metallo-hydrolase [Rufibacter sp. LB8]|uniref:MBL fold metallo-hydrolase n=1 Tax=Rufibacter sp. LB8 TaxID=2777781 RepID=UPI00178C7ED5|nr:MBL fold metallo-hydrolase [Rufibacter sp. LB8]
MSLSLIPIPTGNFKLDGGAMFGVVPKSIWQRTNPADENNLCTWSMRCLLVQTGDRLILIDNGIGDKQDAKFFSHYYLHGEDSLEKSLHKAGFGYSDITDVFLTHLHFDHCGGSVKYGKDGSLETVFGNARYWSNQDHWQWATQPNPREKASFIKENILPIQESSQLNFVDSGASQFLPGFDLTFVDGHTDKMMIPRLKYKGHTVCFVADLLPSVGHLPLPYVMGYDTRPLLTLQEKEAFLKQAADDKWVLFFEHDATNECCTVKHTDKGVRVDQIFPFSEL